MTIPLIQARQISKHFGATKALEGISMDIMPGEIITIIGPNGAGKTTLLRCLLGLENISGGTITRVENLRIGYVPQRVMPPAAMPMNVAYFLKLHSTLNPDITHQLGVDAFLDAPLCSLSGGAWQRVLLARALSTKPQLLVLDEPMQGMDVHAEAECYGLIEQSRRLAHCAVLMVSHDLHVVMAASDRVICIQHHVCCEGNPQQVQDNPAFKAMFGKALADKLALYTHHHAHRHDETGAVITQENNASHLHHEGCHHG